MQAGRWSASLPFSTKVTEERGARFPKPPAHERGMPVVPAGTDRRDLCVTWVRLFGRLSPPIQWMMSIFFVCVDLALAAPATFNR